MPSPDMSKGGRLHCRLTPCGPSLRLVACERPLSAAAGPHGPARRTADKRSRAWATFWAWRRPDEKHTPFLVRMLTGDLRTAEGAARVEYAAWHAGGDPLPSRQRQKVALLMAWHNVTRRCCQPGACTMLLRRRAPLAPSPQVSRAPTKWCSTTTRASLARCSAASGRTTWWPPPTCGARRSPHRTASARARRRTIPCTPRLHLGESSPLRACGRRPGARGQGAGAGGRGQGPGGQGAGGRGQRPGAARLCAHDYPVPL